MARPVHALLSAGDIRPLLRQPGQRQDPEVLVWGPGWGLGVETGSVLSLCGRGNSRVTGGGPRGCAVTLSVEEARFS